MSLQQPKTWLITNCSIGFGRVIAQAILTTGDNLIATACNLDAIADIATEYPQQAISDFDRT
jgi:NADP-dependent 3-hydroxy acid dehydrogenase YdfG